MKFDIIVAGAGTAGCLTAKTAAKAGLRVCLLDVKNRKDIGKKICGDAIGKHHFENLNLKPPAKNELERIMEGVRIYSPDRQTSYVVKGEKLYGYILNRHQFGQRLLNEAQDTGTTLHDNTQVLEPIIKNGYVNGVHAKNQKTGEKTILEASITVDATGFVAAIRKRLPPEIGIDVKVDNIDVEACYREIRQLKQPLDEPDLCQIYLDQKATPGGYYWIFPEGNSRVNVGLGVAMVAGFPNPREQFYRHIVSQPLFEGSSVINGGAWFVPTRRPLDSMVGNGIVIVGDAACMVNPIHGGGIGPSMMGGFLAGEVAAGALERGDVSCRGLWGLNVGFMSGYGVKQAGLEVFRVLLQCLDDDDLNFGMQFRLLTEEDLLRASLGEDARFTIDEKARRVFRGLRKLGFLRRLVRASRLMRQVREWYRGYPDSPENFEEWRAGVGKVFGRVATAFER